jgi:hypothetical protein
MNIHWTLGLFLGIKFGIAKHIYNFLSCSAVHLNQYYWNVSVYVCALWYVLVRTNTYKYVLVCTDHRDCDPVPHHPPSPDKEVWRCVQHCFITVQTTNPCFGISQSSTHHYIPVHFRTYSDRNMIFEDVSVHTVTSTYLYVPVHTRISFVHCSMYRHLPFVLIVQCTLLQYVGIHGDIHHLVLLCSNLSRCTGF